MIEVATNCTPPLLENLPGNGSDSPKPLCSKGFGPYPPLGGQFGQPRAL